MNKIFQSVFLLLNVAMVQSSVDLRPHKDDLFYKKIIEKIHCASEQHFQYFQVIRETFINNQLNQPEKDLLEIELQEIIKNEMMLIHTAAKFVYDLQPVTFKNVGLFLQDVDNFIEGFHTDYPDFTDKDLSEEKMLIIFYRYAVRN